MWSNTEVPYIFIEKRDALHCFSKHIQHFLNTQLELITKPYSQMFCYDSHFATFYPFKCAFLRLTPINFDQTVRQWHSLPIHANLLVRCEVDEIFLTQSAILITNKRAQLVLSTHFLPFVRYAAQRWIIAHFCVSL